MVRSGAMFLFVIVCAIYCLICVSKWSVLVVFCVFMPFICLWFGVVQIYVCYCDHDQSTIVCVVLQCLFWCFAVLMFVVLLGVLCVDVVEGILLCGNVCVFNDELPVVCCVEGYNVLACMFVFLFACWIVLCYCSFVLYVYVLLYLVGLVCCEVIPGDLVRGVLVILVQAVIDDCVIQRCVVCACGCGG